MWEAKIKIEHFIIVVIVAVVVSCVTCHHRTVLADVVVVVVVVFTFGFREPATLGLQNRSLGVAVRFAEYNSEISYVLLFTPRHVRSKVGPVSGLFLRRRVVAFAASVAQDKRYTEPFYRERVLSKRRSRFRKADRSIGLATNTSMTWSFIPENEQQISATLAKSVAMDQDASQLIVS